MIDLLNGALTLNQNMLRSLRESPDLVRRGLMLVLLVGLLVGAINGINTALTVSDTDRVINELREGIEESLRQQSLSATTPEQREAIRLLNENTEPFLDLVRRLIELPTPLPGPAGAVLQGLGVLASQPLSYLGGMLLAVLLAHIAARQLGGVGSLQQSVGLGALSVAPHALDALGFIPVLGPTLELIAWFWGLVILVAAMSVAHRLDSGRATMAVLLYPVVGTLLLFLLGCCAFLGLVVLAAGR